MGTKHKAVLLLQEKGGERIKKYSNATLKSYTKDILIEIIHCIENNIEEVEEMNNNQFQILMQKDLEREKYKWHDLRKDPTDLPEAGKPVLVASDIGGFYVYSTGHLTDGKWRIVSATVNGYGFIAWKYIDPFEVEE